MTKTRKEDTYWLSQKELDEISQQALRSTHEKFHIRNLVEERAKKRKLMDDKPVHPISDDEAEFAIRQRETATIH
jgi:hypothetical protein